MKLRSYQLQPGPLGNNHIARPQLMRRLRDTVSRYRITMLEAPAGYGKSQVVAEFLQSCGQRWAFLPCEPLKAANPLDFLGGLLQVLRHGDPSFGQATEGLSALPANGVAETTLPETAEHILTAILEILHDSDTPLLMVIEDYHVLQTADLRALVVDLISNGPPQLKFLVTSRFKPAWPARLFSSGMVGRIEWEALLFTTQECRDLAQSMQVRLDESDLEATVSYIGGWPILYSMLCRRLQGRDGCRMLEQLRELNRPEQEMFEFIASELLSSLPEAEQDLLCKTAVLSRIDHELCAAIFGVQPAEMYLVRFEKYGFLTCVDVQERPIYLHSHEILREFLSQQLGLRHGADHKELYAQVGAFYERRAELEDAIRAYAQSQNIADVVRIVTEHGMSLVLTSDIKKLDLWLGCIPQPVIDLHPELLVYQGIVWIEYQRELADIPLQKAVADFQRASNLAGEIWACSELVWMYSLIGLFDQARRLMPIMIEQQQCLDVLRRGRLLFAVGMFYVGVDSCGEGERYMHQAIELYRSAHTIECKKALPRMLRYLGHCLVNQGKCLPALRVFEESVSLAKTLSFSGESLAWLQFQVATMHYSMGAFALSLAAFEEVELAISEIMEDYTNHHLYEWITIRRGHIYRDMGDYAAAQQCYETVKKGRNGIKMALRLVQRDRVHEALPHATERYYRSRNYQSPVDRAQNEAVLGLVYLSLSEQDPALQSEYLTTARKYLEQALQVFERYDARYSLSTYRMYLAYLYLLLEKTFDAGTCLQYVLREMRMNGYYHLDVWQPWVVAKLCVFAIINGIEAEFAKDLAVRRLDSEMAGLFIPLVNHFDPGVRGLAIEILHGLGRSLIVDAFQLLEKAKADDQTKQRLTNALKREFLTAAGMFRLKIQYRLSWREIDTFILWITPLFHGSPNKIARAIYLAPTTIKEYIEILQGKLNIVENEEESPADGEKKDRKTGLFIVAYDWAVREHIINPYASNDHDIS
jgi:tetratricopeptide (TPR) repeat protein